jgi:hypothetical protein
MTGPVPSTAPAAAAPAAEGEVLHFGLHVASILCWVVGAVSLLSTLTVGRPGIDGAASMWVAFGVNLTASLAVAGAGFAVRRRRRLGAYLVCLGWLLPNGASLALGGSLRLGGLLLALAIITVLANWHELR